MKGITLQRRSINFRSSIPFLSAGLAFVVGAIILYAAGVDPINAYQIMLKGAFGSIRGIADTLVKTTSLLLVGLAVAVAFKCRIWNIGAEGQLYMGALGAALIGITAVGAIPGLALIAVIAVGFAFGGSFGLITGLEVPGLEVTTKKRGSREESARRAWIIFKENPFDPRLRKHYFRAD